MIELKAVLFVIASSLGSLASIIVIIDKVRTWFRPDPDSDGMLLVEKKIKTKTGYVRFHYTKKEATRRVIKELNDTKTELNELRNNKIPRLRLIYASFIVVLVALVVIFSIRCSKK